MPDTHAIACQNLVCLQFSLCGPALAHSVTVSSSYLRTSGNVSAKVCRDDVMPHPATARYHFNIHHLLASEITVIYFICLYNDY